MTFFKSSTGEVFRLTADGKAAYAAGISDAPRHKRKATPADIRRYELQHAVVWDIVQQFLPLAKAIAFKLSGRVDMEMVHDVGIPVIVRCTQLFDPTRGEFKPYVSQALKRRFFDHLRHRLKLQRRQEELVDRYAKDDQRFVELEDADLVSTIVGSLGEYERALIDLYYFKGLTMQEIADTAGCAKSTISNAIKQALSGVRERLKP